MTVGRHSLMVATALALVWLAQPDSAEARSAEGSQDRSASQDAPPETAVAATDTDQSGRDEPADEATRHADQPSKPALLQPIDTFRQAGAGRPDPDAVDAYATSGIVEVGGSFGLSMAGGMTMFEMSPTVGWFFADRWALSSITSFVYRHNGAQTTELLTTGDISYHVPLTDLSYGFAGLGMGVAATDQVDPEGPTSIGFAGRTRFGFDLHLGTSGILRPQAAMTYASNGPVVAAGDQLVDGRLSFVLSVGFLVFW